MVEMPSIAKRGPDAFQIPDGSRQSMIPFRTGLRKPKVLVAAFGGGAVPAGHFENIFLSAGEYAYHMMRFPVLPDDFTSDFQFANFRPAGRGQDFGIQWLGFPHTLASVNHDARRPVLTARLDGVKHTHSVFLLCQH
ncbi:MAG: hypothetical protein J6W70_01750, partial [Lentisphaeria bacterium]|nr:hypothetical protein [Lentisphaeria bacterium]